MDLTQIVNTDIDFSKATLEDILARYSVKSKGTTSTTNKTPASVRTALLALRQAYARVHGNKQDTYGDLTWLTVANLQKPGKFVMARPLFDGAAHPDATPAMSLVLEPETVRRNLENFRSVLYSASQHLKTVDMADNDRDKLLKQYSKQYDEFGKLATKLQEAELKRLATREPSKRQQSKWVSWPELKKFEKTVTQSLDQTFRSAPASMNSTTNKKMQRSLQFLMYTLLPPVRGGDFTALRFITPEQENMEELVESNSPNYIVVKDNGSMELVINRYKMDNRSKAMDYDPQHDFEINTSATRRFPLVANATLTEYRFDPVKLAALLANYRSVQQSVLGDRNPHEYLFFELKRDATVVPVSAEGLSTRMARITGRLFGQTLGATMFRTMFVSWFQSKKPTMAERETMADRMFHSVRTAQGVYAKGTMVPPKRVATQQGSGGKRQRVTVQNMHI